MPIKAQNVQAAVGRIGAQPALPDQQFQLTIQTKGRLSTVEEFEQHRRSRQSRRLVRAHQGRRARGARREVVANRSAGRTASRRR